MSLYLIYLKRQITLKNGWLEHNPIEILENTYKTIDIVLEKLEKRQIPLKNLKSIGITNQRETVVAWNKSTGKPYSNAIVWCDARTKDICDRFITKYKSKNFFKKVNGLPINTYFTAFKIRWLIENVKEIQENLKDIYFGTIDAWLVYNLTGNFLTDFSNASRTFLMNLHTLEWDKSILEAFEIPVESLPQLRKSTDDFGVINKTKLKEICVKIDAVLGDQHAASLGHGNFEIGDLKHTYGTEISEESGLLSTVLFDLGKHSEGTVYALEGSIETGASILNWMKTNLKMFDSFEEMTKAAMSVENSGGVYFVPAFTGLYAPFWNEKANAIIVGLTLFTQKEHLIRAAVESICYRTKDIIVEMESLTKKNLKDLKVDGGISVNNFIMQLQADVLQRNILRTEIVDSTCLGVAFAAGLQKGIYKDIEEVKKLIGVEKTFNFNPNLQKDSEINYENWKKALKKSLE